MSRSTPLPLRAPRMTRLRAATCALTFAALLGGCTDDAAPSWDALVRSSTPPERPSSAELTWANGPTLQVVSAEGPPWIETRISADDWTETRPGAWMYDVPFEIETTSASSARHELRAAGREFTNLAEGYRGRPEGIEAGSFLVARSRVHLQLERGEEPPEECVLRFETNLSVAAPWHRVDDGDVCADGFTLLPGERHALTLGAGSERTLRFFTLIEGGPSSTGETGRFTIEADGAPLFTHEVAITPGQSLESHTVDLPAGDEKELHVAFEGPLTHAAVLTPIVGPRETGPRGDRAWGHTRPDLVLFVADTLRADCLEAYGGIPQLMPNTNALLADSLVFERAWSTSTWTLPTHASLFTGLHPRQVNAIDPLNALPESMVTLAEILRDHGYRTIAVSDGAYVSAAHGFGQGFEAFFEIGGSIEETLSLVERLLAVDDGRPTFLFVQTYHVHTPYNVSDEARASHGELLGMPQGVSYDDMIARLEEDSSLLSDADFLEDFRALYLGSAVDLDRHFARFLTLLRDAGVLPDGNLVYVSDHGEAFGEHERVGHGGEGIEEIARVPLAIHGPAPGVRTEAVSLIDVAPTLLELAGIVAPADWAGHSLLSPAPEREVLFTWGGSDLPHPVGIVDDWQKLFVTVPEDSAPRLDRAYDLRSDPSEEDDVADGTRVPLSEAALERLSDAMRSRVTAEASVMSAERRAELEALGYGGN